MSNGLAQDPPRGSTPEPADPEDDIALMLRSRDQDDPDAFALLVRRHQRPLMNFFARCGVYGDIEDLAQETFLRLYRYRARYTPTAQFTTFLYLLARQVRIDDLRRARRRGQLHQRAAAEMEQEFHPPATARGGRLDVERSLEELSDPMREVVVLAIVQGMKQREVAEVLNIPVGTVKSRLSTALLRLRSFLEGESE